MHKSFHPTEKLSTDSVMAFVDVLCIHLSTYRKSSESSVTRGAVLEPVNSLSREGSVTHSTEQSP